MADDKIPCPYCGGLIYRTAQKCRYCKEWIKPQRQIRKPALDQLRSIGIQVEEPQGQEKKYSVGNSSARADNQTRMVIGVLVVAAFLAWLAFSRPNTDNLPAISATKPSTPNTVVVPTSTPAPAPSSLAEQLQSVAVQELGAKLLDNKLDAGGAIAVIEYDLDGTFNEDSAIFQGAYHLSKLAPKVFLISQQLISLELIGSATFDDVYGHKSREWGFKFSLRRETADRIDWNQFLIQNFGVILAASPNGLYLHPSFRASWNRFSSNK